MKPKLEAPELRSRVVATRNDGKRFLCHLDLSLSCKGGKLRLAGAKRPGVFRVPIESVRKIHWRGRWHVDFEVGGQIYELSFQSPQWEQRLMKFGWLMKLGMPGAILLCLWWRHHHGEMNELNGREAKPWHTVLKESQIDDGFALPT